MNTESVLHTSQIVVLRSYTQIFLFGSKWSHSSGVKAIHSVQGKWFSYLVTKQMVKTVQMVVRKITASKLFQIFILQC